MSEGYYCNSATLDGRSGLDSFMETCDVSSTASFKGDGCPVACLLGVDVFDDGCTDSDGTEGHAVSKR